MFWDRFQYHCNRIKEFPNRVARNCGIRSTGTVSGWKNGATPNKKTLQKLAEYFGIEVEDLLDESTVAEPMSDSDQWLLDMYHRADANDRTAIHLILCKYEKSAELSVSVG